MTRGKPWGEDDLTRLIALRERVPPPSWAAIAMEFPGRTATDCSARYHYEVEKRFRGERRRYAPAREDAPARYGDMAARFTERDARRAGYDARDYTQSYFNDPPVGFSALDQKRRGV